jgi:hypothetical protein
MSVSILDILKSGFTPLGRHTTSFSGAKLRTLDNKYSLDRKREMQPQKSSVVEYLKD